MRKIYYMFFVVAALALCSLIFTACDAKKEEKIEVTSPSAQVSEAQEASTDVKSSTFTGLPALEPVSFTASDPENSRALSVERHDFSYGVASGGVASHQSVINQDSFDKIGFGAVAYDRRSDDKRLYLTFDCGWENGCTNGILDTLKEKGVTAAFFCTLEMIDKEPALVARMINEGHVVGNHSSKHPAFSDISRERMAKELEDCENRLRESFGYSSKFFRFPAGVYTECALELVKSMGFTSVFWSVAYADWDVNASKGADYAYEKIMSRLHPGAVILLHSVSPDNGKILASVIDDARAQGYRFASIEDLP